MKETEQKSSGPLLGELLLKEGLITKDQLQEALRIQTTLKIYKPLGRLFLEQKVLSPTQLTAILDRHRKRPNLGQIMLKSKMIDPQQLDEAVVYQKTHKTRLGRAVLRLNFVSEQNLKEALATQLNIDFINLDSLDLGPHLATWIKKGYAQRFRMCPVALVGNELTVVLDDPTNVSVIREIETSSKKKVKIVTATEAMIARALKRVYDIEDPAAAKEDRAKDDLAPGTDSYELVIEEDFTFPQKGIAFEEDKPLGPSPEDKRIPL